MAWLYRIAPPPFLVVRGGRGEPQASEVLTKIRSRVRSGSSRSCGLEGAIGIARFEPRESDTQLDQRRSAGIEGTSRISARHRADGPRSDRLGGRPLDEIRSAVWRRPRLAPTYRSHIR